jgi:NAD(P)-dependent dehydrogenase (short-subunit alcohol dehydrogenase family)
MNAKKKRAVVTGASRGIGRVTALGLARKGWDVTLVVRDRARGQRVIEEANALGAGGETDMFVADLSSMNDVARVAREILAAHPSIDVLINNAGGFHSRRSTTADGLERTFATNHLAPFLLTKLLRPALEAAAPARVVVVASAAHRRAHMTWDDLMHERSYPGFKVYSESKLANILFARELARRLGGTGVTANALHPGFVASNFGRDNPGLAGLTMPIAMLFAISEEQGAETSLYLATSSDVEGVTGKYFAKSREATPTSAAQSDEDARRLWEVSEGLVAKALGAV